MKIRLSIILVLGFVLLSFSQQSSNIDFVIRNLGVNVDGHFNTFTINAELDSNNELKKLSGKITVSSIRTGIESRDEHLLKEDYFDMENHKYITLKSTSISKESDTKYIVKADLSIKGKTKKITIPVTVQKVNEKRRVSSYFEINRRDFDVGGGSFVMSKTVKINVVHYQNM